VEVGPGVTTVAPGDQVLPVSMPECGQCRNCISGKTNLCLEFFKHFCSDSPFSRQGQPVSQFLGCGTFSNYTTVKEIAVAKIRCLTTLSKSQSDSEAHSGCIPASRKG
jgi:S-(hydroxymethyl)glutathione dehydrogenase/alcohol dehydrogenase